MKEMQQTWVWSLGWEELLEEEVATHSSVPAWRIPWAEDPGRLQSTGPQSQTWLQQLSMHACIITSYIWGLSDNHQFSSVAQSCPTLCCPKNCSMPGLPVYHQLLEPTQTHVHWVTDAIQPPHPLSSLVLLHSIIPSIRVFSNESVLHIKWPKYCSFSFSISPSNKYSGLISFRMDWLDLLAVQGTYKSLLQYHSSKASVLRRSASL